LDIYTSRVFMVSQKGGVVVNTHRCLQFEPRWRGAALSDSRSISWQQAAPGNSSWCILSYRSVDHRRHSTYEV